MTKIVVKGVVGRGVRKTPQPEFDFDSPSDIICGVDEAGRGPLAGPVVAAAVIFDPSKPKIRGLDDSKVLSAKKRDAADRLTQR